MDTDQWYAQAEHEVRQTSREDAPGGAKNTARRGRAEDEEISDGQIRERRQ